MSFMKLFVAVALIAGGVRGQAVSVAASTSGLLFRAAPLRGGSMIQQVDGAVKFLKSTGRVLKIRAFVTPEADGKVVVAAIQKTFPSASRPVVRWVQIAKLPEPGAVVLLEGIAASTRVENPNGLAFISGQLTQEPRGATVASLVARPSANLIAIATGLGIGASDFLRVTCFASSVEDSVQVLALVQGTFPLASSSVMQIQRAPTTSVVECEAVARLRTSVADAVRLVNPTGAAFAQAAVVTAQQMIFTSTFIDGSSDDAGVRKVFATLRDALKAGGIAMDRVFYVSAYPGDQATLDRFRALRFEVLERAKAPASTNLVFEGGAGERLDVDVIAVVAEK